MFYHLLVAVAGVVGLIGLWVVVQALVRHESPEMAHDTDVLACRSCGTADGCHGCSHSNDKPQQT